MSQTCLSIIVALVHPFVDGSSSGIHEEVADGAELQAKLLGYRHLHFFGWPLGLLEDGMQRSPLDIGEDEAWFLDVVVGWWRFGIFFFLLASWS